MKSPTVRPASSTASETTEECRILDQTMYRMGAQWAIETTKVAGKREQLLMLLREVGPTRFAHGIVDCIKHHDSEFCPPIAIIRKHVPPDATRQRKWRRNPACPVCHGSGWEDVPDYEGNRIYGRTDSMAVRRCREEGCLQWLT